MKNLLIGILVFAQQATAQVDFNQWEFTAPTNVVRSQLVNDAVLGRDVLEISRDAKAKPFALRSKAPVTGAYVVEAWVRFPQPRLLPQAALSSPAAAIEAGVGSNQFLWAGRVGTNLLKRGGLTPFVKLADISPLAPESYRLETEAAVAKLPVPAQTWIPLRLEVEPTRVRMYYDGMLVTEQANAGAVDGPVELTFLHSPVRLAKLEVKPAKPTSPFVCVPLEFRLNAAGTLNVSAPEVHGIPFQYGTGISSNDHVDVGVSVFRHRFGTRYAAEIAPENHTQSPNDFEPGRIRLSVPPRAYARAWVLAGVKDDPLRAPVLTVRFYKPMTDWATDATTVVPGPNAKPFGKLWLIPVELNTAELVANYRGAMWSIELTKAILPNVGYPDPCNYSYQPGGLPSSVQVYGLTLEEAPVWAMAHSDVKGGLYPAPATPNWRVTLRNQTAQELPVTVRLVVTDPYGKSESLEKAVRLKAGEEQIPVFPLKPAMNGLHTVRTTVSAGNWQQSREGTFVALPAISRKATGANSRWGVWTWNGTHETNPNLEEVAQQLVALGAINQFELEELVDRRNKITRNLHDLRAKWGLGAAHYRLVPRLVPDLDATGAAEYRESKGKEAQALLAAHPDLQYVNCFAENTVSLRLSHGIPAWALGQPESVHDAKESARVQQLLTAANAAAEGVRQYAPGLKFLFGHGAACFALPFLREKNWNSDLIAGFGMDMPQFERMPERQPRATEPSLLYFLSKELKARGLADKEIVHLESYFPSSHELALGLRGQADSVVRTAVLSLSLGTTKFMHTWCLQDCWDRWGSSHYSGSALIGREPESFPKPSAAAFATMTRVLDTARYDGWLETGSRSAFCLRFKDGDRQVYAVWTVRGSRPLEIVSKGALVRIDENGNEFPVKGPVTLTPTVQWLVGNIQSVQAGPPTFTDAPSGRQLVLGGRWNYDASPYNRYASNNWDMVREPVRMTQESITSTVWRVTMAQRPAGKPCVGFYGVFTPEKPIAIPGKARALGVYGKGDSQWFRLIYEVVDAKGETWLSCGERNAWNSDDIHSWSYFNHDGWRYMEFPLPASAPGDNYREKSCYSWGGDGDGIVDLPLKLTRVIVEMRTDMIYVNELLPVKELSVELDNLMAVYDDAESMTDKPVKLQAAARDVWRPVLANSILPNPIKQLLESGTGPAPEIEKVFPPEVMESGDQVYVKIKPVTGAQKYTVYVSASEDGVGARPAPVRVEPDPSLLFVRGLQPSVPMYFFATYTDAAGKESKPSAVRKTVLRDEFPFK